MAGQHCVVVVSDQGGLLLSLFITGLVGSVTHCVGMCGPFVLTQVTARLEAVSVRDMGEWHRLRGAMLVPYHLGRMTTYSVLGAAVAGVTGGLSHGVGVRGVSASLLVVAACLLIGTANPRLKIPLPETVPWAARLARLAQPLFASPTGWRGYGLGVVLGFIPCGLLYGALAMAAASHDPLAGAMGMAVFVAGTVPALAVVGLAGHMAGDHFRPWLRKISPALLLVNAGVLLWWAMGLLI